MLAPVRPRPLSALLSWLALLAAAPGAHAQAFSTELVSVTSQGRPGNYESFYPALSADGSRVAFASWAHLAPHDPDPFVDIYVRDLPSGRTVRASKSTNGANSSGHSLFPAISGDGRFVAFSSFGKSLHPADGNFFPDVLVRDLLAGTTELVSVNPSGHAGNGWSGITQTQMFWWTTLGLSLSHDGRYVAFVSSASDLVPGDTNGTADVFVRDRALGITRRVNLGPGGVEADGYSWSCAMSADGRNLAFVSRAKNLAPVPPGLSGQVFVVEVASGAIEHLGEWRHYTHDEESGAPAISADGRYVAWETWPSGILLRDRLAGTTSVVSWSTAGVLAQGRTRQVQLSGDGRLLAFSTKDNLEPGDQGSQWKVYLRDLALRRTERVDMDPSGAKIASSHWARWPSIAADGSAVAFFSDSPDLVPGDANGWEDVFLRRGPFPPPALYCTPASNGPFCEPTLRLTGVPSANGAGALVGDQLPAGQLAAAFHSQLGSVSLPFLGGALCVQPPVARLPALDAGGAVPCGGTYAFDLSEAIAQGRWQPGETVWAQAWFRGNQNQPSGAGLTNALVFSVLP